MIFGPYITQVGWIKSYITIIPSAVDSFLVPADGLTGTAKLIGTLLHIFVAKVSKMDIGFVQLVLS
jgi:hypothetical protein